MKNTILTLTLTALYALTTGGAKAQKGMDSDEGIPFIEEEKIIYVMPKINTENAVIPAGIEPLAVQNFQKKYPGVVNVSWYKTDDGGYIASFNSNNVQTSIAYNKKGKWQHSIFHYKEDKLNEDLWETIKNAYGTYEILKVSEIHFDGEPIYMILIQNKHFIKMLRMYNGELEEVEQHKRLN